MNSNGNFEEDILRDYLNPRSVEKAPERFTENLMSRIEKEAVPKRQNIIAAEKIKIPLIAVMITIVLITIAVTTRQSGDPLLPLLNGFLADTKVKIADMISNSIPDLSVPAIVVYISVGILVLSLLDLTLNRIFHGRRL